MSYHWKIRGISLCTSFGSELNICTVWCKNVNASNILSEIQFDVWKGALNEYQMLIPNFKTQNMNNYWTAELLVHTSLNHKFINTSWCVVWYVWCVVIYETTALVGWKGWPNNTAQLVPAYSMASVLCNSPGTLTRSSKLDALCVVS